MHIHTFVHVQWGACALGIIDVWDMRNGLLWGEPFEKVNEHLDYVFTSYLGPTRNIVCAGISSNRDSCDVSAKHRYLQFPGLAGKSHVQEVVRIWEIITSKVYEPTL